MFGVVGRLHRSRLLNSIWLNGLSVVIVIDTLHTRHSHTHTQLAHNSRLVNCEIALCAHCRKNSKRTREFEWIKRRSHWICARSTRLETTTQMNSMWLFKADLSNRKPCAVAITRTIVHFQYPFAPLRQSIHSFSFILLRHLSVHRLWRHFFLSLLFDFCRGNVTPSSSLPLSKMPAKTKGLCTFYRAVARIQIDAKMKFIECNQFKSWWRGCRRHHNWHIVTIKPKWIFRTKISC